MCVYNKFQIVKNIKVVLNQSNLTLIFYLSKIYKAYWTINSILLIFLLLLLICEIGFVWLESLLFSHGDIIYIWFAINTTFSDLVRKSSWMNFIRFNWEGNLSLWSFWTWSSSFMTLIERLWIKCWLINYFMKNTFKSNKHLWMFDI